MVIGRRSAKGNTRKKIRKQVRTRGKNKVREKYTRGMHEKIGVASLLLS